MGLRRVKLRIENVSMPHADPLCRESNNSGAAYQWPMVPTIPHHSPSLDGSAQFTNGNLPAGKLVSHQLTNGKAALVSGDVEDGEKERPPNSEA